MQRSAQLASPPTPMAVATTKTLEKENKWWVNGAAGGIGGCFSKTLLCPMQRIVVLRQLGQPQHKGLSTMQLARVIQQEEGGGLRGVKAFWRGNLTSILQRFPYSGIQLMVYDRCKHIMMRALEGAGEAGAGASKVTAAPAAAAVAASSSVADRTLGDHLRGVLVKAAAGGLAASISGTAVYPIEVVRTRLMSGDPRYRRITTTAAAIWGEASGPRNFYRGLGASLVQRIPDILINFAVYESVKFELERRGYGLAPCIVMGGTAAALTAVACTFPLDVCKRRLAMAGKQAGGVTYNGTAHCLSHILRHEGPKALYAGAGMEAARCVPQVVLMWFAIDLCREVLNRIA